MPASDFMTFIFAILRFYLFVFDNVYLEDSLKHKGCQGFCYTLNMSRTVLPPNARLVPADANCVFRGIIFDVYQWQQEMFDGSFETFEMLKRPDTVKVIAVVDEKIVILQQQQPDSEIFFDMPGGRHDVPEETELQAAQREMREETGLSFKDWKLLSVHQPAGKIEQFVYFFLATNLVKRESPTPDAGEKITVQYRSLEETKTMAHKPAGRFFPTEILDKVSSLDELYDLPEPPTV